MMTVIERIEGFIFNVEGVMSIIFIVEGAMSIIISFTACVLGGVATMKCSSGLSARES